MNLKITLAACLLSIALILSITGRRENTVLVSAATSLTEVMKEVGASYARAHPDTKIQFNFGASGALQRQIEQGAPVDVFASASTKEMDALEAGKLLSPGTRCNFTGNRLVLIAPTSSAIQNWTDLRSGTVRHVAISDPAFVPSGRYAQEALTKRGLWDAVKPKAVFGENVRQTLSYVANDDAEAGLVFATDARIESNRVKTVAVAVPGKDHQPIVYPVAVLRDAPNSGAARLFVAYLRGPEGQSILKRHGFQPGSAGVTPAKSARRAAQSSK